MKNRIKKHFNIGKLAGATIGAMIVFLLSIPVVSTVTYMYEWVLPASAYVEYDLVSLATDEVKQGDVPVLFSVAHIHKEVDIRWEDTLWCKQNGTVEKYKTQYWPENHGSERFLPKDLNDIELDLEQKLETWSYTAETIQPEAKFCQIRGVAIVTTSKGHEKTVKYNPSKWFPVNR